MDRVGYYERIGFGKCVVNFMGFTRSKEKISIEKKIDEMFLFILVPNTLHFCLYRLVT